jgi:N-acetylglucosamine-6-sulfatase
LTWSPRRPIRPRWLLVASLIVAAIGVAAVAFLAGGPGPSGVPGPVGIHRPAGSPSTATTTRPSIVVVMVDDLPAMDDRILSRLPNIKSLFLDHGVRFADYQGDTPLCCPGRVNVLTGLYTTHHGVVVNDARLFHPEMTIATQLQAAGYYTFIAGKYLNRTGQLADKRPPGWRHAAIAGNGYYDYTMWIDGAERDYGSAPADYSIDVAANLGLTWLRAAPPDQPVFAFLTPFAVHNSPGSQPATAAPRHRGDARCADVPTWATPAYNEADVSDKPGYVQSRPTLTKPGISLLPECEALLSVDELVGEVVAELQAQGRADNTLLIFTSDNGMNYGAHRLMGKDTPYATQVPLFVRWPDQLHEVPATVDETIENIDLAPTLCDVGGCSLGPYPTGQTAPDGRSFLPVLLARGGSMGRDAILQTHPYDWTLQGRMPGWYAARTTPSSTLGRWLYVAYTDGEQELYDLTVDPWMLVNRAGDPAAGDVRSTLRTRVEQLLGGPIPTARPQPSLLPLGSDDDEDGGG